jgi:hypothetical protein
MAEEKALPAQSNPLPPAPSAEELKKVTKKSTKKTAAKKAAEPKEPKVTKKMIVDEFLRNKKTKGATIDTIAQAVADRGVDKDLRANKVTCKLWMSKIGYKVLHDEKTGKYRKAS